MISEIFKAIVTTNNIDFGHAAALATQLSHLLAELRVLYQDMASLVGPLYDELRRAVPHDVVH